MSLRVDWDRSIADKFPSREDACSYCGKNPLPKRRVRYCSDACGHEAYTERGIAIGAPSVIRGELWKRDKGVCARCGKQCSRHSYSGSPWHAHHKIPVSKGGGVRPGKEMTLDDYETLCVDCHKDEHRSKPMKNSPELALV